MAIFSVLVIPAQMMSTVLYLGHVRKHFYFILCFPYPAFAYFWTFWRYIHFYNTGTSILQKLGGNHFTFNSGNFSLKRRTRRRISGRKSVRIADFEPSNIVRRYSVDLLNEDRENDPQKIDLKVHFPLDLTTNLSLYLDRRVPFTRKGPTTERKSTFRSVWYQSYGFLNDGFFKVCHVLLGTLVDNFRLAPRLALLQYYRSFWIR